MWIINGGCFSILHTIIESFLPCFLPPSLPSQFFSIMSNKHFLDIDDTIWTRKLTLPGNDIDLDVDEIAKRLDERPFIIIQPLPGVCIKTKSLEGEKIFLNVCVSDEIPAPEDISDARLFELLNEENPSFTIPMSISSEKLETDKGGAPCTTCDIAINTMYYEKCQKKKHFWIFTLSVIMDGVSNKCGKTLDAENYVILKNRKVMGKLQQHRIRNRQVRMPARSQKPLIEEISPSSGSTHDKEARKQSDFVILKESLEGPAERLIGLFVMSERLTSTDVNVYVDSNRIVITTEIPGCTFDISVPYDININNTKCFLDRNMRILRLDMPIIPKDSS